MTVQTIDFSEHYYRTPTTRPRGGEVRLGSLIFDETDTLDVGDPYGTIHARDLVEAIRARANLTDGTCSMQFSAHLFNLTRQPDALNSYFPLTQSLDSEAREQFHQQVEALTRHPNIDVQLLDERGANRIKQAPDLSYLVAGHIAAMFFYRPDLLDRILTCTQRFRFYTMPRAFQRDGGISGGSYDPRDGTIRLVLSRIYEGFHDPKPGVAPLLHEYGHMLDFLNLSNPTVRKSLGLLPGLRPQDGPVYNQHAHALFREGKQLELDRYLRQHRGTAAPDDVLPIGHPYVFQNDTEFIAGYFEMFCRNPRYFAAQNATLFEALVKLFDQDPRTYLTHDFPFYIQQNQDFYRRSGHRPPAPRLTIQ